MEGEIMSISQLTEHARAVPFNPNIPLRYWVATVQTVLREAEIYEREGNIQKAYGHYYRYVEFVIKRLPNHPEAKAKDRGQNSSVRELKRLMTDVPKILDRMDRLKPMVEAAYESDQRRKRREYEARKSVSSIQRAELGSISLPPSLRPASGQSVARTSIPPSSYGVGRAYGSSDYSDVRRRDSEYAERIAGREWERRESERRRRRESGASSYGGRERLHERSDSGSNLNLSRRSERDRVVSPSSDESAVRSQYIALKQQYDSGYKLPEQASRYRDRPDSPYDLDDDLSSTIRKLGLQAKAPGSSQPRQPTNRDDTRSPTKHRREPSKESDRLKVSYQYPTVPKRSSSSIPISPPPYERDYTSSRSNTPALPPKIRETHNELYELASPSDVPPPVPSKSPILSPSSPRPSTTSSPSYSPSLGNQPRVPPLPPIPPELTRDRREIETPPPKEESKFAFEPSAYLENGRPLRTVFLPEGLRKAFLKIAEPNTRNNLETCGILCGSLVQNALFISKLVIPEQEATSDTCTTKDEEDLFAYVFGDDLLILGWIHTHPTQTCFMSSVDLHTHCSYQLMLDESIAIVCAPRSDPSWGVFRLTDPPGIPTIQNCRESGLFHPHPGSGDIYLDALRPGHVAIIGSSFDVVDLRKNP